MIAQADIASAVEAAGFPGWVVILAALLPVLVAILEGRGRRREARTLTAAIRGVETATGQLAPGSARMIKLAIRGVATAAGIEKHLQARVHEVTGRPSGKPAPSDTPTVGPGPAYRSPPPPASPGMRA